MERIRLVDAVIDVRYHVTASAVVLSTRGVLLHKHRKLDLWLGPGGHIDPGEKPWETAQRETLEETGIATWHPETGPRLLDVSPPHDAAHSHVHFDLRFLLHANPDEPSPPPEESQQVGWFD